jgi:glutamine phosphoribosylpyrophosphate amidotransferase
VAFRDPNGIRPLVIGSTQGNGKAEYMFASESVALDCSGFSTLRDVEPGEGCLSALMVTSMPVSAPRKSVMRPVCSSMSTLPVRIR